jgi:hypothetical protein
VYEYLCIRVKIEGTEESVEQSKFYPNLLLSDKLKLVRRSLSRENQTKKWLNKCLLRSPCRWSTAICDFPNSIEATRNLQNEPRSQIYRR